MKIGLTYDLRSDYLKEGYSPEETAEFDKEETIEGIENALKKIGYETERIGNAKQLMASLIQGKRWDIVFNICEGMYGVGREAQAPAILDVFNIPYVFSDPLVLSLTLHKGMTKRVIKDLGIPTADFSIINTPTDIDQVNLAFPLFVKPSAEGTGKGIDENSKVNNQKDLKKRCLHLLEKFKQPVLVETYLPGREFTVGLVGTGEKAKIVGVMEIIIKTKDENDIYSYQNKENYETLVKYDKAEKEIADKCAEVALQSWNGLGCRDGGRVDIKIDHLGIPNFIEVNPLAGLNYTHSDLPLLSYQNGWTFEQLIKAIMDSALERIKK